MSKQEHIARATSPWVLAVCLLTAGTVALFAAPPPFVQHLFADGDCMPDDPTACGGIGCCGGECCYAPNSCVSGHCCPEGYDYWCNNACSECPCE